MHRFFSSFSFYRYATAINATGTKRQPRCLDCRCGPVDLICFEAAPVNGIESVVFNHVEQINCQGQDSFGA